MSREEMSKRVKTWLAVFVEGRYAPQHKEQAEIYRDYLRLRQELAEAREREPYPLINCPSCAGGNEATVRMDKDSQRVMAVWHCNLCNFEWWHESSVVAAREKNDAD